MQMQHELDELIMFCEKYSYVVCYGAGSCGHTVQEFLRENNITVKAFFVSNNEKGNEMKDGIPVYSVCDNTIELNQCGIILSLDERYQSDVRMNLKKYCINDNNIYGISRNELYLMKLIAFNKKRKEILFRKTAIEKKDKSKYREKMLYLQQEYDGIEIRYIDIQNIGGITLWLYYCYQREKNKDKIYYLYYPITAECEDGRELIGSNGYLLSKLFMKGIEVISEKNIDFWRYFLCNGKQKVIIRDEFQSWGWTTDLQTFINEVNCNKEYINLNKSEIQQGKNELKKMGVKGKYICVSARDKAYYIERLQRAGTEAIMDEYRNSNIQSRCKAIDYLEQHEVQSVRMGCAVESVFNKHGIVDYANKYRTEFMDIYLAANCQFFVSDLGGIQTLAMLFSKPMVILNVALLTTRCDNIPIFNAEKDLAIFKKFWDIKNKRYLTIREMLAIEVDGVIYEENITLNTFRLYREQGIVPIENTQDEVLAVVKEMYERLNGECMYTEEECQLQERYRAIVDNYPKKDNILSQWRIGTEFLKQNMWLLD